MKKVLIILLSIFCVFDFVLALYFFFPKLILRPEIKSLKVRSEISNTTLHITNEKQLRKKLDQLSFWEQQKVNRYRRIIDKVTVEHVEFVTTNKPQFFGQRIDEGVYQYSYGQKYNEESKTMIIYLQLAPTFQSSVPLEKRLSSLALFALFDLTFPFPKKDSSAYDRQLKIFLNDAPVVFRFGLI